ncbi:MAG: phosphoketolase, partial [Lactococcus sp.]
LQKKKGALNQERELSDEEFEKYFGPSGTPVIFGFHGYEDLIESIFYQRGHDGLIVHGYREDGDITTTYDMRVYSELDRFHQAIDAMQVLYVNRKVNQGLAKAFIDRMERTLVKHFEVTRNEGVDIPEFTEWVWSDLTK